MMLAQKLSLVPNKKLASPNLRFKVGGLGVACVRARARVYECVRAHARADFSMPA